MKKQTLFFLMLMVTSALNAQLKVNSTGNIEIGTSPSTDCQFNLKGSSSLDGSVGIGVAPDASYKLNLSGNSYFNGLVGIGVAPNSNYKLNLSGNSYFNGNVGIGITPSTTYKLNLSGNSYFNGNVGIGTAPSTFYKLYVLGKSNFNGESNFQGLSNFWDCRIGGTFSYFPPYRTSPTYSAFQVCGNDNQPALSINPAYAFSSQYLLWVGGDSYITGSWTSSDNQLKKSVTVL